METDQHVCDSGLFDRTVCPDPCGMMHSYCAECGEPAEACAHDDFPRLIMVPAGFIDSLDD